MNFDLILTGLAGVMVTAAPIIFAVIGETIAERSGVINLSVNGTIVLSAMIGFAVAVHTHSLVLGYLAGMIVGGLIAWMRQRGITFTVAGNRERAAAASSCAIWKTTRNARSSPPMAASSSALPVFTMTE